MNLDSVDFLNDKVVIRKLNRTDAGFWLEVVPERIIDRNDHDSLRQTLMEPMSMPTATRFTSKRSKLWS